MYPEGHQRKMVQYGKDKKTRSGWIIHTRAVGAGPAGPAAAAGPMFGVAINLPDAKYSQI